MGMTFSLATILLTMPNLTLELEQTLASLLIVIFFLHSFLVFSTFLMVYTLPALATVAPLVHIIQHLHYSFQRE